MRRDWRAILLSPLAALFIRLLHATLRVRHLRGEVMDDLHTAGRHYVIAFWHSHLMMMLFSRHHKPIMVMSSRHRDGELMVSTYRRFGVDAARGSSSKGATAAMREFLRAARRGSNLAFTPDGPRGPARVAKPGVVLAAQASGYPIAPVAFIAKKKSCCAHGTAFKSPIRSRERSFSTASLLTFRAI